MGGIQGGAGPMIFESHSGQDNIWGILISRLEIGPLMITSYLVIRSMTTPKLYQAG